MATISFVLSGYKKRDGKQAIRLRVIAKDIQYHPTGFQVTAKQFDSGNGRVKTNHTNHVGINEALDSIYRRVEKANATLTQKGINFTAKQLIDEAFASHDFYDIAKDFMEEIVAYRTAKKYISVINGLKEYRPVLNVEDITVRFLKDYKAHLLKKGNKHNTVINRLGSIRTIYAQSPVKLPINPFDTFEVGSYQKSGKEPLTMAEITAIWNFEPEHPAHRLAKDTFLFSFYAAGMRSEDVLTLKWSNIEDKHIVYYQGKKEHQGAPPLRIALNSFLETILSGYDRGTKTIFNVIDLSLPENQLIMSVESRQASINRILKLIAQRVGITKHIMFKIARSTFADIANKKSNRNIYGIQQSMGHTKISTTEIYLGNDQSAIDDLLRLVYG